MSNEKVTLKSLYLGERDGDKRSKNLVFEIDKNDCWNVTSHFKDREGYIRLERVVNGYKYKTAHRVVYSYYIKDLEGTGLVRHLCNNTSCVNPMHLAIGSDQDNMTDRMKSGGYHLPNVGGKKITENQVLKIDKMIRSGKESIDISKELGINQSIIYSIKSGKAWNYLTGRTRPEKYMSKSESSMKEYTDNLKKERGEYNWDINSRS